MAFFTFKMNGIEDKLMTFLCCTYMKNRELFSFFSSIASEVIIQQNIHHMLKFKKGCS